MNNNLIWKILVIAGSVIGILSCLFPFYTVSALGFSRSVTYIQGDGILVCICLAISLVFAFFKPLIKWGIIPTGIAALITLYDIAMAGPQSKGYGSIGIGAILLLIALAAAITGQVMSFIKKQPKVVSEQTIPYE